MPKRRATFALNKRVSTQYVTKVFVCLSVLSCFLYIRTLLDATNETKTCADASPPLGAYAQSRALEYMQRLGFIMDTMNTQSRPADNIQPNSFALQTCASGPLKAVATLVPVDLSEFLENSVKEVNCMEARQIPSDSNGTIWICDPHRIKQKVKCLIYLIGSFNYSHVERGILPAVGNHCEVHNFMLRSGNGASNGFNGGDDESMHHWRLMPSDMSGSFARNAGAFPTYQIKEVMGWLNHTRRMVDLVRMDCEFCSFAVLRDLLIQLGDVGQLLLKTSFPLATSVLRDLHDLGFRTFRYEIFGSRDSMYVEISFINFNNFKESRILKYGYKPHVHVKKKEISVMIRTWHDDTEFALIAIGTAIRELGEDMLELVIVTDDYSEQLVRRDLYYPLQEKYGAVVKFYVEHLFLRDGHTQQKYSKLMADTYTKGDFILHLDSDCAVIRWGDDCYLENGLPVNDYASYESLRAGNSRIWKKGTELALGIENEENEYSRLNQHVYPRTAYALVRKRMEEVHGVPFVNIFEKENFIGKRRKRNESNMTLISDFNLIGAAVFHFAPQLMFQKNVTKGSEEKRRPICISQCNARRYSLECCLVWFQEQMNETTITSYISPKFCDKAT